MSRVPNEFRVQRAGDFTLGYGLGWFAHHEPTETGAWFSTWREAIDWADAEARRRMDEVHASRSGRRTPSPTLRPIRKAPKVAQARLAALGWTFPKGADDE